MPHRGRKEWKMEDMKNQKISDAETEKVTGGITHRGQKIVCPICGEEILMGREEPNEEGVWVIEWHCPRCKKCVATSPL